MRRWPSRRAGLEASAQDRKFIGRPHGGYLSSSSRSRVFGLPCGLQPETAPVLPFSWAPRLRDGAALSQSPPAQSLKADRFNFYSLVKEPSRAAFAARPMSTFGIGESVADFGGGSIVFSSPLSRAGRAGLTRRSRLTLGIGGELDERYGVTADRARAKDGAVKCRARSLCRFEPHFRSVDGAARGLKFAVGDRKGRNVAALTAQDAFARRSELVDGCQSEFA
jgi:hypothetical protein